MQAATTSNVGSWNCAKDIYQQAGVKGLCRGMIATVAREVPSYIGQFGTYEWLKIKLTPEGEETKDLSPARTVVAGGCAGTVCWVISYPMVRSCLRLSVYGGGLRAVVLTACLWPAWLVCSVCLVARTSSSP